MSDPVCDPALFRLLKTARVQSEAPRFAELGLTLAELVQLDDVALVQQLIDAHVIFPASQVAIVQHVRWARLRTGEPKAKRPKVEQPKVEQPECDHPLGWLLMARGAGCQDKVGERKRWALRFCNEYGLALEDTCRLRAACRLTAQLWGPLVAKWTLTPSRRCHACHSVSKEIAGDWRCLECCVAEGRLLMSTQIPPDTLTALVCKFGQREIRRQGILWSELRATPGATELIEEALDAIRQALQAPRPHGTGLPKKNPIFPHHHFVL